MYLQHNVFDRNIYTNTYSLGIVVATRDAIQNLYPSELIEMCIKLQTNGRNTHTFVYAFGFFPRLQNDSFGILWNARLCQFAFQEGNSAHNVAAVAAIRLKQRISMFERCEANDKESKKTAERTQASALWRHFFGTIKTTYNDERWIDNICVVLEKYYIHERVMMIWRQRHVCHVLLFVWVCVWYKMKCDLAFVVLSLCRLFRFVIK